MGDESGAGIALLAGREILQQQQSKLENALTYQIRNFLLELGMGCSFLGNQYPIKVSGKE